MSIIQNFNYNSPINEVFIPILPEIIPDICCRYMISNFGTIYDTEDNKYLKLYPCGTSTNGKYYYSVNLKTNNGIKSYRVHRLVLACFFPEKGSIDQKMDVNHKNGIKTSNFVDPDNYENSNLEWLSRSENIKHAYETGLHGVGEKHANSVLTDEIAMKVIELLDTGLYTSKQICELINYPGLTTHVVDDIRKKTSYKYLSQGHVFNQRINRLFKESDIHNFCKSFQNHKDDNLGINENCRIALYENGFDTSARNIDTLRKIYTRKYYKNIVSLYIW